MAELESAIEKSLIDKLCHDTSQWTYRPDIKTEKQLKAEIVKQLDSLSTKELNFINKSIKELKFLK